MLALWLVLSGLFLYLECIYHISGFGFKLVNPLFTIFVIMAWAAVETMLVMVAKGRGKKILFQIFLWWSIFWTVAQTTYLHIFKQPMLWEAVFRGGQDALTNYWREALTGFMEVSPYVIAMVVPGIIICVLLHKKKWKLPEFKVLSFMRVLLTLVVFVSSSFVFMAVGKATDSDYYENYTDFFDPLTVAEDMGVHPMLQRDTVLSVKQAVENAAYKSKKKQQAKNPTPGVPTPGPAAPSPTPQATADPGTEHAEGEPTETGEPVPQASPTPEVFVPSPNVFALDQETLLSLADNKKQNWLAEYIINDPPTMTNEYTGIFEGYNLIFLTAEGFSPYAVREDKTPTLYHLIHTGFVFNNYYVPLWQTSTSDGEYVNNTGLIPDGQFSMRKSASNAMPYTMAGFFNRTGIQSRAYHNNSLSYYDRHVTHPNLGYLFKACNLGDLDEAQYGQYVFEMETSKRWPPSDYQMMISTMPEYVNDERFYTYYMTVSGHMNYNFKGNSMSALNKDAVADLDMSENARAYIACHIELDKALEYILEQLKEAGQLEKTVIVMSADHYPYAMTSEQYEELAGKSLSGGKDLFRNNLILWNVQFEENPVVIDKPCCSVDILPTLLNLFGFEFDSRMYAGRDIFSTDEGLVIFNDRSFVTDGVIYNRKTKETIWLKDGEGNLIVPQDQQEAYLAQKQQLVKDRYQFSAYILQENYYQDVEEARIRE